MLGNTVRHTLVSRVLSLDSLVPETNEWAWMTKKFATVYGE